MVMQAARVADTALRLASLQKPRRLIWGHPPGWRWRGGVDRIDRSGRRRRSMAGRQDYTRAGCITDGAALACVRLGGNCPYGYIFLRHSILWLSHQHEKCFLGLEVSGPGV